MSTQDERYYHKIKLLDVEAKNKTSIREGVHSYWTEIGATLQYQSCFVVFTTSLLPVPDGLAAFRTFLKTEFSDENIEFWMACEEYKKIKSSTKLVSKANKIYKEFIDIQAPREVCDCACVSICVVFSSSNQ